MCKYGIRYCWVLSSQLSPAAVWDYHWGSSCYITDSTHHRETHSHVHSVTVAPVCFGDGRWWMAPYNKLPWFSRTVCMLQWWCVTERWVTPECHVNYCKCRRFQWAREPLRWDFLSCSWFQLSQRHISAVPVRRALEPQLSSCALLVTPHATCSTPPFLSSHLLCWERSTCGGVALLFHGNLEKTVSDVIYFPFSHFKKCPFITVFKLFIRIRIVSKVLCVRGLQMCSGCGQKCDAVYLSQTCTEMKLTASWFWICSP